MAKQRKYKGYRTLEDLSPEEREKNVRKKLSGHLNRLEEVIKLNTEREKLINNRAYNDATSRIDNLIKQAEDYDINVKEEETRYWVLIKPIEEVFSKIIKSRTENEEGELLPRNNYEKAGYRTNHYTPSLQGRALHNEKNRIKENGGRRERPKKIRI